MGVTIVWEEQWDRGKGEDWFTQYSYIQLYGSKKFCWDLTQDGNYQQQECIAHFKRLEDFDSPPHLIDVNIFREEYI